MPSPSNTIQALRERVQAAKQRGSDAREAVSERTQPAREEAAASRDELEDLGNELGLSSDDNNDTVDPFRQEVREYVEEGRDVQDLLDDRGVDPEPFSDPFSDSVDAAGEFGQQFSEADEDYETAELEESDNGSQGVVSATMEAGRRVVAAGQRVAESVDVEGGQRQQPQSGRSGRSQQQTQTRSESGQQATGGIFGGGDGGFGLGGPDEGGVFGSPRRERRQQDTGDGQQSRGGVFGGGGLNGGDQESVFDDDGLW